MGLPYMPISWGGFEDQCRHIWHTWSVWVRWCGIDMTLTPFQPTQYSYIGKGSNTWSIMMIMECLGLESQGQIILNKRTPAVW